MTRASLLPLVLVAACGPSHPVVSVSRRSLLASGYSTAVITVSGTNRRPVIAFFGDNHFSHFSEPLRTADHWESTFTSSIIPGKVTLLVKTSASGSSKLTLELMPQTSDSANDGTPDYLRLDDPADQDAFRRWFTFLAEVQFFNSHSPAEISDCSALLRYSYREALRRHNESWAADANLPLLPAIPSTQKYTFPHTPLGANLFRNRLGTFAASDVSDGTFAQFANAESLQRFNTFFISRDIARAKPGDLLFYRRTSTHITYHSMIFVGRSQVNRDDEIYVVYHTGPEGTNQGEIRRLSVNQLLHFPDPQWQPIAANPSFLGIFRWNILKASS